MNRSEDKRNAQTACQSRITSPGLSARHLATPDGRSAVPNGFHAAWYHLAARAFAHVGNALCLALIAKQLSVTEQGYYFTFNSALTIRVFYDLGLCQSLVQVLSRSSYNASFTKSRGEIHLADVQKMGAIARAGLSWATVASILMSAGLIAGGQLLFGARPTGISWFRPWLVLSVAVATSSIASATVAVIEGCGFVVDVARYRVAEAVISTTGLLVALECGAKLASGAVPYLLSTATTAGFCWKFRHVLLTLILGSRSRPLRGAYCELWPTQVRIACTSLCGFFMFHLVNPIAFRVLGPVAAAQVGFSLGVTNALVNTAYAAISPFIPQMCGQAAQKKFAELNRMFVVLALVSSAAVAFALMLVVFADMRANALRLKIAERLLQPGPLSMLAFAALANHITSVHLIYFRAHQREPLLPYAAVAAAAVALVVPPVTALYGTTGLTATYATVLFISGPIVGQWYVRRLLRQCRETTS